MLKKLLCIFSLSALLIILNLGVVFAQDPEQITLVLPDHSVELKLGNPPVSALSVEDEPPFNQALLLDEGDGVMISPTITISNGFMFMGWAQWDYKSSSLSQCIFSHAAVSLCVEKRSISTSELVLKISSYGDSVLRMDNKFDDGQFHFFYVIHYVGQEIEVYVDGMLLGVLKTSSLNYINEQISQLYVGNNGAGQSFHGMIDDLSFLRQIGPYEFRYETYFKFDGDYSDSWGEYGGEAIGTPEFYPEIAQIVPIYGLYLEGESHGPIGVPYTWTASVGPENVSLPITFTWSFDDQVIEVEQTDDITSTFTYTPTKVGFPVRVKVEAQNVGVEVWSAEFLFTGEPNPIITEITPMSIYIGDQVCLLGDRLAQTNPGTDDFLFVNMYQNEASVYQWAKESHGVNVPLTDSWSNEKVCFTLPTEISLGEYELEVDLSGYETNRAVIEVQEPVIGQTWVVYLPIIIQQRILTGTEPIEISTPMSTSIPLPTHTAIPLPTSTATASPTMTPPPPPLF